MAGKFIPLVMKSRSTTITQIRRNHQNYLSMLQHRIFIKTLDLNLVRRALAFLYYEFKPKETFTEEPNWSNLDEHSSAQISPGTTKLFFCVIILIHMHRWSREILLRPLYSTEVASCLLRSMACRNITSHHPKIPKIRSISGWPEKMKHLSDAVSLCCQKDSN